jgi:hypothetical protein
MRSKLADLREKRSNLQRQLETAAAESKAAFEQRESLIVNLRSQLNHRNQELDGLEQSAINTQEERTRLQLLSTEMSVSVVSLRRELDESRAAMAAARVSEEAGRQQLARMMDEQLTQNQTIETLRRQIETSNNTARDTQSLLRTHKEQQNRMPPPTNYPVATGGIITNTPFTTSSSTPSTGMRTRELHGPGYYHVGSPADPGYAEQMNAMYGREERDPLIQDPPRYDPPSYGSSSRGSSSQATHGSRIVPNRRIDPRDTTHQRVLKFGTSKVPRLTKTTLVNIHQLLRHEAFDDSVLGNLIDNETITLLRYIFRPTETASRHPIVNHWTVDWDVATIIEALELYPLQAEHKHLDLGSRWQQAIDNSVRRVRIQADNMEQVRSNDCRPHTPQPEQTHPEELVQIIHSSRQSAWRVQSQHSLSAGLG